MRQPAVYILASKRNGTLYTGVAIDLPQRVSDHKQSEVDGFTKRHGVNKLVYYEFLGTMPQAIKREKQIKKWNRQWKVRLIERRNPKWTDLYERII